MQWICTHSYAHYPAEESLDDKWYTVRAMKNPPAATSEHLSGKILVIEIFASPTDQKEPELLYLSQKERLSSITEVKY